MVRVHLAMYAAAFRDTDPVPDEQPRVNRESVALGRSLILRLGMSLRLSLSFEIKFERKVQFRVERKSAVCSQHVKPKSKFGIHVVGI